ncbi:Z-ring formation inhibitor MciZ [Metabacillus endolithicus]|uniref:Z-ring formation inhibitor MciZ n=1 Tax=Metabacillus endolithicus TaxID=1535204 RepID=A0ABW5BXB2_9BACI
MFKVLITFKAWSVRSKLKQYSVWFSKI